ncbi:MAG: 2-amino-4-hydroxy-6-hydroxymethyldihydropteridine diphosphokinase [Alphaproteobacteria bacterium]|jgi:2-amino-4-hydroxy-6-hydroxymethyldihydropteridine diphosphokinase
MILIGLGGNLDSPRFGSPAATQEEALTRLAAGGISVAGRSRRYRTAPVPASDQPWYVNQVVCVESDLTPHALLDLLLETERAIGRLRGVRNAARIVDLDLLDYHGWRISTPTLILPHPRLAERGFVLHPLRDVAPDWYHPVTGTHVDALVDALPSDQTVECDDTEANLPRLAVSNLR